MVSAGEGQNFIQEQIPACSESRSCRTQGTKIFMRIRPIISKHRFLPVEGCSGGPRILSVKGHDTILRSWRKGGRWAYLPSFFKPVSHNPPLWQAHHLLLVSPPSTLLRKHFLHSAEPGNVHSRLYIIQTDSFAVDLGECGRLWLEISLLWLHQLRHYRSTGSCNCTYRLLYAHIASFFLCLDQR